MNCIKLLLLSTLLFSFGCKQKTQLKNPRNLPNGVEFSGNYSPNVISPTEIIYDLDSLECPLNLPEGVDCDDVVGFFGPIGIPTMAPAEIQRNQIDPNLDDDDDFFGGAGDLIGIVFDLVGYVINQGDKEDENEIDLDVSFLDQRVEDAFNDENVPTNYKNPSYVDLTKNPPSFRVPQLSDFCQTTDANTQYIAHKYMADNFEVDVYAFGVIGQCDNVMVRCAVLYFVEEGLSQVDPQQMMNQMYSPIGFAGALFQHPFVTTQIMGINGSHMNCQKIDVPAYPRPGCTDTAALTYTEYNNISVSEACIYPQEGCTDITATNFNPVANISDNDTCTYDVLGCTDAGADNYNPAATLDDGSCTYTVAGCTDVTANNYDPSATVDDGSCTYDLLGCTDITATNYDPSATLDDGSCTYDVLGCTDPTANNYDPLATTDDGSCTYTVFGCLAPTALNYNPAATESDGSCICDTGFIIDGTGSACVPDVGGGGIPGP